MSEAGGGGVRVSWMCQGLRACSFPLLDLMKSTGMGGTLTGFGCVRTGPGRCAEGLSVAHGPLLGVGWRRRPAGWVQHTHVVQQLSSAQQLHAAPCLELQCLHAGACCTC